MLMTLLLLASSPYQVDYYYFTAPYCATCKQQTPIVEQLNKEGYNFQIKTDSFRKYNIEKIPAFLVVVKENNTTIVTVKFENKHLTRKQLKLMVFTTNTLTR